MTGPSLFVAGEGSSSSFLQEAGFRGKVKCGWKRGSKKQSPYPDQSEQSNKRKGGTETEIERELRS